MYISIIYVVSGQTEVGTESLQYCMPLATHDMLVPCLGMGLGTNGGCRDYGIFFRPYSQP